MANLRAKDFELGTPTVIGFKAAGANVEGGYGPQVRWQTTNGDTLYLDADVASDIEREMQELGIRAGENFRLTRAKTSHGGSRWVVERTGGGDSGGHNVPGDRLTVGSVRAIDAPAPRAAVAAAAAQQPITSAAARLLAAYMVAIDTLVESRVYGQRKGLTLEITMETVRCLAATVIINPEVAR